MPRKRRLSTTSGIRYTAKVARLWSGIAPPELATTVASTQSQAWGLGYGEYYAAYNAMLRRFGGRIPRLMLGLYRSFLLKALKEAKKGTDVNTIIDAFANQGLDRGLLEEIARYFGLIETSTEASTPA